MSFGRLGSMGRGMGHLGSLGTVVPSNALTINGVPLTIDGQYLTISG
jgi:hypothetical protein